MGALGRVRRKVEGAEAQEIGGREFEKAIERAAAKKQMPAAMYMYLVILFALEADGEVHVQERPEGLEICFTPEQCAGHC